MTAAALMERLGMPGIVGIALLLGCVAFYLAATAPARAEVQALHAESDRLTAAAEQAGRQRAQAVPAQTLPSFAQAPELLKRLNEIAQKDGVTVTRSSYQVRAADSTRVFEVDLPLRLTYPMLRAYLRDVLALDPTARLADLNLHRAQAADPMLDADVRFSFNFSAAS